jgi:hypothetical protein
MFTVARRCGRGKDEPSRIKEFGISRKVGYKIFDRYQEWDLEGLHIYH